MQYGLNKLGAKIDDYINILNEETKNLLNGKSPTLLLVNDNDCDEHQKLINTIRTKFELLLNNINAALEKNPDQQINLNIPDESGISIESLYHQIPVLKESLKEEVPLSELLIELQQQNRQLNNESSDSILNNNKLKKNFLNLEKNIENFIKIQTTNTRQTIWLNRPLDRNSIEEQIDFINKQICVPVHLDQLSMKINALLNEKIDEETKLHLEDIKIAIKTIPPSNRAETTIHLPGGLEDDAKGLIRQKLYIMNELDENGADLNGGSKQKRNELIEAINQEIFVEKEFIDDLLQLDTIIKEGNPNKIIRGKFSTSITQNSNKTPSPTTNYPLKFFIRTVEGRLANCFEKIGDLQRKALRLYLEYAEREVSNIISELQAEDDNLIPGNIKFEALLVKIRNDKEKIIRGICDDFSNIVSDGPEKNELEKIGSRIRSLDEAGKNLMSILDEIESCPKSVIDNSAINIQGLEKITKHPETVIEQIKILNDKERSNHKPDRKPPSKGPTLDR